MSTQVITEMALIGSVFVLTGVGLYRLRHARMTGLQKLEKFLTGLLGAFLLMAGTVKFFDPFVHMFTAQIALSGLPFPTLSKWAGQLGEISAGASFLLLLLLGSQVGARVHQLLFTGTTLLTMVIMLVAVYVHLVPEVTAEVLPLQSKPPVLTLVVMAMVSLNAWLYRRNRMKALGRG